MFGNLQGHLHKWHSVMGVHQLQSDHMALPRVPLVVVDIKIQLLVVSCPFPFINSLCIKLLPGCSCMLHWMLVMAQVGQIIKNTKNHGLVEPCLVSSRPYNLVIAIV